MHTSLLEDRHQHRGDGPVSSGAGDGGWGKRPAFVRLSRSLARDCIKTAQSAKKRLCHARCRAEPPRRTSWVHLGYIRSAHDRARDGRVRHCTHVCSSLASRLQLITSWCRRRAQDRTIRDTEGPAATGDFGSHTQVGTIGSDIGYSNSQPTLFSDYAPRKPLITPSDLSSVRAFSTELPDPHHSPQ
jgi:hypothetical protein